MTQTSSARLRPDERRAQILGAARRVLLADPHRELTVELVAAEAGVFPALLFHYFGSKKKFQYAVIEEAAAEVILRTAPDPALAPGRAAPVRHPLAFRPGGPGGATALPGHAADVEPAGDPAVRALHSEIRQVFSQWVISAVAERGIEITPTVELACHGWAGVRRTDADGGGSTIPSVSAEVLEHLLRAVPGRHPHDDSRSGLNGRVLGC